MVFHTAKARKIRNIAMISKQKQLLQLQKIKLSRQLARSGVTGEIASLKAQRFVLARQTRELRLAKLRRFQKGISRTRSFLKALGK